MITFSPILFFMTAHMAILTIVFYMTICIADIVDMAMLAAYITRLTAYMTGLIAYLAGLTAYVTGLIAYVAGLTANLPRWMADGVRLTAYVTGLIAYGAGLAAYVTGLIAYGAGLTAFISCVLLYCSTQGVGPQSKQNN